MKLETLLEHMGTLESYHHGEDGAVVRGNSETLGIEVRGDLAEVESVARLICAAPELVKACRAALAALLEEDDAATWLELKITLERALHEAS